MTPFEQIDARIAATLMEIPEDDLASRMVVDKVYRAFCETLQTCEELGLTSAPVARALVLLVANIVRDTSIATSETPEAMQVLLMLNIEGILGLDSKETNDEQRTGRRVYPH